MCVNNYNQGLFRPSADAISSLISVEFVLKVKVVLLLSAYVTSSKTVAQFSTTFSKFVKRILKSNKPQYQHLSGQKLPIIASEPTWR